SIIIFCFFFQAEDGIRDRNVTGVQTCALPICRGDVHDVAAVGEDVERIRRLVLGQVGRRVDLRQEVQARVVREAAEEVEVGEIQIGRASCRERGESSGGGGRGKEKDVERCGQR